MPELGNLEYTFPEDRMRDVGPIKESGPREHSKSCPISLKFHITRFVDSRHFKARTVGIAKQQQQGNLFKRCTETRAHAQGRGEVVCCTHRPQGYCCRRDDRLPSCPTDHPGRPCLLVHCNEIRSAAGSPMWLVFDNRKFRTEHLQRAQYIFTV